jgi:hypothetical protein
MIPVLSSTREGKQAMKSMIFVSRLDVCTFTDHDMRTMYASGFRIPGNGESELYMVAGDYIPSGWTEVRPSAVDEPQLRVTVHGGGPIGGPVTPQGIAARPAGALVVPAALLSSHPLPVIGVRPFPNGAGVNRRTSVLWYHGTHVVRDGRRRWQCDYCEYLLSKNEPHVSSLLNSTPGTTSFVLEGHGVAYAHLLDKYRLPRNQL